MKLIITINLWWGLGLFKSIWRAPSKSNFVQIKLIWKIFEFKLKMKKFDLIWFENMICNVKIWFDLICKMGFSNKFDLIWFETMILYLKIWFHLIWALIFISKIWFNLTSQKFGYSSTWSYRLLVLCLQKNITQYIIVTSVVGHCWIGLF